MNNRIKDIEVASEFTNKKALLKLFVSGALGIPWWRHCLSSRQGIPGAPSPITFKKKSKINFLFYFIILNILLTACATPNIAPDPTPEPSVHPIATPKPPLPSANLTIGPRTKLAITVYDEPELTKEVVVAGDHTISYAFLGKISVKGLTASQVEGKLKRILAKDYLVDPHVQVQVKEWGYVYIFGKVQTPGLYPMVEGMSVLEAVVAAGGFSPEALRTTIQLVRTENHEKKLYALAIRDAGQGSLNLDTPIEVQPGDSIIVY